MVRVLFEAVVKFKAHGRQKFHGLGPYHGYHMIDEVSFLYESAIQEVEDLTDDELMLNETARFWEVYADHLPGENPCIKEFTVMRVRRLEKQQKKPPVVPPVVVEAELEEMFSRLTVDQKREALSAVGLRVSTVSSESAGAAAASSK